jgi:hypothetical protein
MIVEGTHPFIRIDLGKNESDMTLQRREDREWVDYKVDGKVVKSPVDMKEPPVIDGPNSNRRNSYFSCLQIASRQPSHVCQPHYDSHRH